MQEYWQEMWRFNTARFSVVWEVTPDYDCDLSFDESGETLAKLNSGEWVCFTSRMSVLLDGESIAEDYLGGSIYADASNFRDHIGCNPIAIKARALRDFRRAKTEWAKRIAYCGEKLASGEWGIAHYMRSTRDARESIRKARAEYSHLLAMADRGGFGSYFSDMVRSAIAEARGHLAKPASARPYIRTQSRPDLAPQYQTI